MIGGRMGGFVGMWVGLLRMCVSVSSSKGYFI
jgi:hypothetical protein